MEKGNGIGSEAAETELHAESALPTGPQATNTVEGDNGRQPESSEAHLGMSEGNKEARSEE